MASTAAGWAAWQEEEEEQQQGGDDAAVPHAEQHLPPLPAGWTALADEEGARLSTLGAALARLAVHPRLGKLLLLSGLFRCVQPMLSIAAGLGYKSPFLCPLGKEREADRTLTLTQTLPLTQTLTLTLTPALAPTLSLTRSARRTRPSATWQEARAPTTSLWCARSTAGVRGATASRRATSCRRPPSSTSAGCGAT